MSEWLKLRDVPSASPQGPGVLFNVVVSPYEIPDAARGFKAPSGRFRIEFRYIDGSEAAHEVPVDQHVTAFHGRHSGRLLALEVDVDGLGAKSVGVAFLQVMERRIDSAWTNILKGSPADQQQALEHAREAFKTREQEVLGQLAACQ